MIVKFGIEDLRIKEGDEEVYVVSKWGLRKMLEIKKLFLGEEYDEEFWRKFYDVEYSRCEKCGEFYIKGGVCSCKVKVEDLWM